MPKKAFFNPNMNPNKPIFPLFFISFIHLLLTQPSSSSQICPITSCRRAEPLIRFPFHLQTRQPAACGYPGFDLSCDAFNRTLIELPNSGSFTVQFIDYAAQNAYLNDPDDCLPRRLLGLNLTGSPFDGYFFQDFTLFNCTSSFDYRRYRFDPIACMSGESYTVFASSSDRGIGVLAGRCGLVGTVAVPVQWAFFQPVWTSDLSDDIRIAWGSPRCRRCEARGGVCEFKSLKSTMIGCRDVRHRLPKTARYAIIIGAALPAFLCLGGLLCFICSRLISRHRRRHLPIMEFSVVVVPHPAITTTMSGLDGQTIDSFPKTTLGESCRLPKPDDTICTICLSEYMPKETLRSIPECQHCFHAECIDEWLRLNSSCPVCRNSPKNSPPPPPLHAREF